MCGIHVSSLKRVVNIFSVACYCDAEVELRGLIHVYCDKVTVRYNYNHFTCHVMDERCNQIAV